MELPQALREALERQQEKTGITQTELTREARALSQRYRQQKRGDVRLLTGDAQAAAYAASRMPATYSAVYTALKHALAYAEWRPQTLLDVGAGTGAASWAAAGQLDLKKTICVEREDAMRRLGKSLGAEHQALRHAEWLSMDILSEKWTPNADLVIGAYVLNELPKEALPDIIKKMWDAAGMLLLLVEPGTPSGYSHIALARDLLLKEGACITAPCPHENGCPFTSEHPDFTHKCHFVCRVARSRLHRRLKGGEVPYEDEKFSYIALTRRACQRAEARVLRHPQIRSGYVKLSLCTPEGIQDVTLSKKDGERYRQARKAAAGDALGFEKTDRGKLI